MKTKGDGYHQLYILTVIYWNRFRFTRQHPFCRDDTNTPFSTLRPKAKVSLFSSLYNTLICGSVVTSCSIRPRKQTRSVHFNMLVSLLQTNSNPNNLIPSQNSDVSCSFSSVDKVHSRCCQCLLQLAAIQPRIQLRTLCSHSQYYWNNSAHSHPSLNYGVFLLQSGDHLF